MSINSQATRPLQVNTPLGKEVLLLTSIAGEEAISELFSFRLELLARNQQTVEFEKLLGRYSTVLIRLPQGSQRYITGIVKGISQGERDSEFTAYSMEIVPQLWLLTRRFQSRIFQQMSVPEILKKVLTGLDVEWRLQGTFHDRDYCVQYNESDFAFASRLMEEEGICYFYLHGNGSHKLVLANSAQAHPPLPGESRVLYDNMAGGNRPEDRVVSWRKTQELRSGKVSLRDHCFELTGQSLAAEDLIQEQVQVGKVAHKLKLTANAPLEIYAYPGQYAQRFDGIDPSGGERSAELKKIFDDNRRTARIRMQEESAQALVISGESTCGQLTAGHRLQLSGHFDADGPYLATRILHSARNADEYRTNGEHGFEYKNQFTCIPFDLPYRPPRKTPKPVIHGTQTAVVVGPKGEEIFTDKYGRVKVQFPWDREGKFDAGSSCWVRVASSWAGKKWGGLNIPRIGHEVVVAFEEGDPDRPIIVGNVYNDQNPVPVALPSKRMVSGLRSATYPGNGGFNEITMDDSKNAESMFIHAQKDQTTVVGNNRVTSIGNDSNELVAHDRTRTVNNDEQVTVVNNRTQNVGVDESQSVGNNRTTVIGSNNTDTIGANDAKVVGANQSVTVAANQANSVGAALNESVGSFRNAAVGLIDSTNAGLVEQISAGLVVAISAGVTLTLSGPGGSIIIGPSGIEIKGKKIIIKGDTVHINP